MPKEELTRKQKAVVEAALDPANKTVTAIAKAAGVHRVSASRALQNTALIGAIATRKDKMEALRPQTVAGLKRITTLITDLLSPQDIIDEQGKVVGEAQISIEDMHRAHDMLTKSLKTFHDLGIGSGQEEASEAQAEEGVIDDMKRLYHLGMKYQGDYAVLEEVIQMFHETGEICDPSAAQVSGMVTIEVGASISSLDEPISLTLKENENE